MGGIVSWVAVLSKRFPREGSERQNQAGIVKEPLVRTGRGRISILMVQIPHDLTEE